jgi:hypothetical protein
MLDCCITLAARAQCLRAMMMTWLEGSCLSPITDLQVSLLPGHRSWSRFVMEGTNFRGTLGLF